MFISVKVKINYNPFSKDRLKRIWLIIFPIILSLILTISNIYLKFVPRDLVDALFQTLHICAGLCAVIQVTRNYKAGVYVPLDNMKSGIISLVIWGVLLILSRFTLPAKRVYPAEPHYNIITTIVYYIIMIPPAWIMEFLEYLFNHYFAFQYTAIHSFALSNVLVGFFSVYCFLGAAIRFAKTLKQNHNLELAK